jgi:spore coat protein U-like protein
VKAKEVRIMIDQKRLVFSALLGLGIFGGAYAGSVGTTIDVSVNVIAACSVTTSSPFVIPDYDGSTDIGGPLGTIDVTCSAGVPYNVALDGGQNYVAGSASGRFLSDGLGNFLPYGLMTEADPAVFWGDSDFAATTEWPSVAFVGTGVLQSHTVPGGVGAGNDVPFGTYSDVVTVTVHY